MDVNILIVEDNVSVCDTMQEFLRMAEYEVSVSHSAEEAIELLKRTNFEVVIADIVLSQMSGLELTKYIKERYEADVIVMTGYSKDYSYEVAVEWGASDFLFKPVRFEEVLLRLKRVLKEQQLKKAHNEILKKLQELVITDDLTKLYNLRHFYDRLKTETDRSSRYRHPVSLLFIDIDSFKHYNDTYGHIEGDKLLIKVARILKLSVRKTDSVYRYAGDEFTVILPETDAEGAKNVARRIINNMRNENFLLENGEYAEIAVSIGISEYDHGEDLEIFVKRADEAMFTSKREGHNKITAC
jgi:diguanylate cyclase (GGDEF)-like protein